MEIKNIIEEKNIKPTPARIELLEQLKMGNAPISFDSIKNDIHMDKATFYRNIAKFESSGIVHSFEGNDKKNYYELSDLPHAHFICNVCNHIECLKKIEVNTLEGYQVTDIIYKGICKSCADSQKVR
jgi:Fur family ferric uptake transcriptional regulator